MRPRGHVDCIFCREGLAAAGDDLAGIDADPDVELELCYRFTHGDRGPNGARGVVLVHLREAEDRHRGVADELLDRAAMLFDDRSQLAVLARHELTHQFGIWSLAQWG
jgi:hypothetical protein